MGCSSASESLEMSASTRESTVNLLMDMSAPPVCVRQFDCVGLCVYQDCGVYRNPQVKIAKFKASPVHPNNRQMVLKVQEQRIRPVG